MYNLLQASMATSSSSLSSPSSSYSSSLASPFSSSSCSRFSYSFLKQPLQLAPNFNKLVIVLLSFLLLSSFITLVGGATCTSRDISISQSRVSSGSSGIPQFIVQIFNTCTTGCAPSQVHLNCGWFASAEMVNPMLFHRIAFNDCLVNAGLPLSRDHIIRFTYQNSFMYPLSFKSASFC